MPWIAVLLLGIARPQAFQISPEIAGPLSLALMGSLITSGGFIQMIARRGQFYICLKEPALARRICIFFVRLGAGSSLILSFIGLGAGLYFGFCPARSLVIAVFYYLALSLLWMTCAVLTIQEHGWRVPLVFTGGGLAFVVLKAGVGVSPLFAQLGAVSATLITAVSLAVIGFRSPAGRPQSVSGEMELPRLPVLLHSLAPYFYFGIAYFSFLFADRIAAGSSITLFSGLNSGEDADYTRGMNIALLSFLFMAAVVEFLNYRFMTYWYAQARTVGDAGLPMMKSRLRGRYKAFVIIIVALFALAGWSSWVLLSWVQRSPFDASVNYTAFVGGFGYLGLSISLFNAVVLFSLNRPWPVFRAIMPGLLVNLLAGYILSHGFGTRYAVVGLVLGAAVFAIRSTSAVSKTLAQPDYAYYSA